MSSAYNDTSTNTKRPVNTSNWRLWLFNSRYDMYVQLCCKHINTANGDNTLSPCAFPISTVIKRHDVIESHWWRCLSVSPSGSHTILFSTPNAIGLAMFRRGRHNWGGEFRGHKNAIFAYLALSLKWYKLGLYLLWNAKANRNQAFECYHFQWSWVTSNPDFKVTILINIK